MAELLTASQLAKEWGCSRFWVNSLIRRGKLKAEKIGGIYMIKAKDADNYQHQPGGRPSNGHTPGASPRKKSRKRTTAKLKKST
jgi:hypothetical protein